MDSITRIKNFIGSCFPNWEKVDFSEFEENIDFRKEWSELYKISGGEIILISYTNISITGTDRAKPQLRVFLDEYKKPFYFAKKHQLRFYLFSIFTKEDNMARGLNNFNPKEYIISIETNLDNEDSRRDLRSIYDYANVKLNGSKFLKCTRANYKADINQASFIYIGTQEKPEKDTFETFINMFDSRPYINSANGTSAPIQRISPLKSDTKNLCYLTAIRTKPFLLLAGISGTGKSRTVRKLAQMTVTEDLQKKYDKEYNGIDFENDRWNLHTPANFKLIQVKPNWHNSMDVVGYLTNIPKPHYVFTPFVEFIARAWQHQDIPFFLCLDEMNLAPVEEYFAEFLSAIESRAFENHNGEDVYVTDPIIKPFVEFDTESVKLSEGMINTLLPKIEPASGEEGSKILRISEHFKHKGLTLPKNLIVIGTVNMDETTYSFSRKVLDRAMSFEMNDVDYVKFLEGKTDDELKAIYEELKDNLNELLTDRHIEAKEIISQLGEDARFVVSYLDKVNKLLVGTPFKLGYRAANEAMLYVMAARETRLGDALTAMNDFTLMKILSRFEGDFAKMRIDPKDKRLEVLGYSSDEVKDKRPESADRDAITILSCMHKIIEDMLMPAKETVTETDGDETSLFTEEGETMVEATKQENKQLTSLMKLESMMDQLNRERFVSYWN